jgi:peptidoglycan-associated lipoprotein
MLGNQGRPALALLALGAATACSHPPPPQPPAPPFAESFSRPPARPPSSVAVPDPARDNAQVRQASLFFDLDAYTLRDDAGPLLQQIAEAAKSSGGTVHIEGNCDERGTPEYNLALGEHRARTAARYLETLGIPKARISVVSYGDQRPQAAGHDEKAWARNRRDDIAVR